MEKLSGTGRSQDSDCHGHCGSLSRLADCKVQEDCGPERVPAAAGRARAVTAVAGPSRWRVFSKASMHLPLTGRVGV